MEIQSGKGEEAMGARWIPKASSHGYESAGGLKPHQYLIALRYSLLWFEFPSRSRYQGTR